MLLNDLTGVIETLRARIQNHRSLLKVNETRTRMALIDPLLTLLGWEVANPSLVIPEYDVSGSRADYALLDASGSPVALMEAKKLDESLMSHRMQMVNYANMSAVPYAGLTDGNHWELYKVFDQRPIGERRVLETSIVDHPIHESALNLLTLWRSNLEPGQPVLAGEPILAPRKESAKPAAPEHSKPSSARVQRQVRPSAVRSRWLPLADFVARDGDKLPPSIRMPDGSEHSVEKWRHLVERTATWLWTKNLLTEHNIPVASSNRRYIVNMEPVHPTGKQFFHECHIYNTLLVYEGNIGAPGAVSSVRKLLKHCGQNLSEVHVRTGG